MYCFLAIVGSLLAAEPSGPSWSAFLGQGASSPAIAGTFPLTWSHEENIAWTAELPGYGQSSPVVWSDQVYVTSVEGPMKNRYFVTALSLATGQVLWQQRLDSSDPVKSSLFVSRAAPTPAVDERGVYAFFESGDLAAFDHGGEEIWRRSLSADYGRFQNEFGLGASPLQDKESLFLLIDHEGPSYLVRVGKRDGGTLWKTDRSPRRSWSSPAWLTVGERRHIVCSSAGTVDGYDPAKGRLLWSFGEVGGNTLTTPLSYAKGCCLISASPGRRGENALEARQSNLLLQVGLEDGTFRAQPLWRTEEAAVGFASPIVHHGCAYWINSVGALFCLDVKSGELHYVHRLRQPCWATPLAIGDRIYCFGKDGLTTVLLPGPVFRVLAENQLWDPKSVVVDEAVVANEKDKERRRAANRLAGPIQYGVAAVSGSFLIRTGNRLHCVRE